MRKIKQTNRPYVIRFERDGRCLLDSAADIGAAVERIAVRFSKRANRGERASVYRNGELVRRATN
jgi:hypothetical protein